MRSRKWARTAPSGRLKPLVAEGTPVIRLFSRHNRGVTVARMVSDCQKRKRRDSKVAIYGAVLATITAIIVVYGFAEKHLKDEKPIVVEVPIAPAPALKAELSPTPNLPTVSPAPSEESKVAEGHRQQIKPHHRQIASNGQPRAEDLNRRELGTLRAPPTLIVPKPPANQAPLPVHPQIYQTPALPTQPQTPPFTDLALGFAKIGTAPIAVPVLFFESILKDTAPHRT